MAMSLWDIFQNSGSMTLIQENKVQKLERKLALDTRFTPPDALCAPGLVLRMHGVPSRGKVLAGQDPFSRLFQGPVQL